MPAETTFQFGRPVRPEQPDALTEGALHYAFVRCQPLVNHIIQHPIATPWSTSPLGEEQSVPVFLRWEGDVALQVGIAVRYQAARAKGSASDASITITRDGEDPIVIGSEYIKTEEHDAIAFPARWLVLPKRLSVDAESEEEILITGEDVRIHTVCLFGISPREVG